MSTEDLTASAIPAKLLAAKRAASAQLLSAAAPPSLVTASASSTKPEHNVVGVGVGRKVVAGQATGEQAIRIYVDRKVPLMAVPQEFRLPAEIEGVPTDVVETGRFYALVLAEPASPSVIINQRRLRPAKPGCSVGFQFPAPSGMVMAGTFGAVVGAGGVKYILSNNHVLANENALPIGSPIFQPGLLDGGDPAHDQIAELSKFIQLMPGQSNKVDCAIAKLLDPKSSSATLLPRVGRLKRAAPVPAVEGMGVHKVGRTTGYTTGKVFDVAADVQVGYEIGVLTFADQVLIQGDRGMFSDAGDSGSLIVDRATQQATALLFAGSRSHTIANHIEDVLAALGVVLVI